jgi:hypothetical protein
LNISVHKSLTKRRPDENRESISIKPLEENRRASIKPLEENRRASVKLLEENKSTSTLKDSIKLKHSDDKPAIKNTS